MTAHAVNTNRRSLNRSGAIPRFPGMREISSGGPGRSPFGAFVACCDACPLPYAHMQACRCAEGRLAAGDCAVRRPELAGAPRLAANLPKSPRIGREAATPAADDFGTGVSRSAVALASEQALSVRERATVIRPELDRRAVRPAGVHRRNVVEVATVRQGKMTTGPVTFRTRNRPPTGPPTRCRSAELGRRHARSSPVSCRLRPWSARARRSR